MEVQQVKASEQNGSSLFLGIRVPLVIVGLVLGLILIGAHLYVPFSQFRDHWQAEIGGKSTIAVLDAEIGSVQVPLWVAEQVKTWNHSKLTASDWAYAQKNPKVARWLTGLNKWQIEALKGIWSGEFQREEPLFFSVKDGKIVISVEEMKAIQPSTARWEPFFLVTPDGKRSLVYVPMPKLVSTEPQPVRWVKADTGAKPQ